MWVIRTRCLFFLSASRIFGKCNFASAKFDNVEIWNNKHSCLYVQCSKLRLENVQYVRYLVGWSEWNISTWNWFVRQTITTRRRARESQFLSIPYLCEVNEKLPLLNCANFVFKPHNEQINPQLSWTIWVCRADESGKNLCSGKILSKSNDRNLQLLLNYIVSDLIELKSRQRKSWMGEVIEWKIHFLFFLDYHQV